MNYKKHILKLPASLIVVAMLVWLGCAAKTNISKIKPAEVSLGGIRTLALLKFEGRFGETVRSDFYSKLNEVPHFNLIDTSNTNALDQIVYDQVDDPRFLPALENLHADGVITGRVSANINDIRGYDQVQMQEGTGRYKKEKNIFGKWVNVEIKKTVLRPVPYVIRQASLTTDFKVFNLKTKQIIATNKVTENYNQKFGGDKEYALSLLGGMKLSKLPAPNQTLNELSANVASRLVAKISPTKVTETIEFYDGGKFGYGSHDMIKRGIEFAKRGLWDEAKAIWQDVIKAEPNNAAAYYNLGVAHEFIGNLKNLQTARTMYKKAARYGDNKLYLNALARIQSAIRDRQKYEQQKNILKQTPVKKTQEEKGVRIY
ncbi:MAG: DUF6340 family protein [Thermodesulfobacteriota bacterium]|nr:DUF6340 family protein [Thermodesulfobacteriota bacterium]